MNSLFSLAYHNILFQIRIMMKVQLAIPISWITRQLSFPLYKMFSIQQITLIAIVSFS